MTRAARAACRRFSMSDFINIVSKYDNI